MINTCCSWALDISRVQGSQESYIIDNISRLPVIMPTEFICHKAMFMLPCFSCWCYAPTPKCVCGELPPGRVGFLAYGHINTSTGQLPTLSREWFSGTKMQILASGSCQSTLKGWRPVEVGGWLCLLQPRPIFLWQWWITVKVFHFFFQTYLYYKYCAWNFVVWWYFPLVLFTFSILLDLFPSFKDHIVFFWIALF